ncbi:MAG TPA: hypothetical protein VHS96_00415 [Bacteroidia bacterium]|nr:hypothetical protein [Bacteroidia bacterium]
MDKLISMTMVIVSETLPQLSNEFGSEALIERAFFMEKARQKAEQVLGFKLEEDEAMVKKKWGKNQSSRDTFAFLVFASAVVG